MAPTDAIYNQMLNSVVETAAQEYLKDPEKLKVLIMSQALKSVAYNSFNNSNVVSNETQKFRDDFADLSNWDVVSQNDDDIISSRGNAFGSQYKSISKGSDYSKSTLLLSKFILQGPFRVALGMSLSQRLLQENIRFGFVAVDDNGKPIQTISQPEPVAIATYSQTTTTATITTAVPHNLVPGDRVYIYGLSDSRACLGNCIVATITSPTVFTVTSFFDGTTITTGTISATGGFIQKTDALGFYDNAMALEWSGASATKVKFISRSNKSSCQESGQITSGTSVAVANSAAAYIDALVQAVDFDLRMKAEGVAVRTIASDAQTAPVVVIKKNRVMPDVTLKYKMFICIKNQKDSTGVAANIVSIAKAGSTTATVTTATPHNLTTGDYVYILGNYNQTNNLGSATAVVVASVIDETHFTCVWGTSTTGTAYGGAVLRATGQQTSTACAGLIPGVQSMTVDANYITITANATMASLLLIGDTVQLFGLVGTDGTPYPAYEGVYRVASVSTTTLVLFNDDLRALNNVRLGLSIPAVKATLGATAMGGAMLKRTDLRLHALRVFGYTRTTVDIDAGNGNLDAQESLSVQVANALSTALTAGTAVIGDVGGAVRATTGGLASNFRLTEAAASVNATNVKATAGRVYKIFGQSKAAADRYLKLYNKATAPSVGTDTPVITKTILAGQPFEIDFGLLGYYFATGIGFGLTTGAADADTGALTASDITGLNITYA